MSMTTYTLISYEDALEKYSDHTRAAHAIIWSRSDLKLWDKYPMGAKIMMQMRFDGYIGFPGGLIDEGEQHLVGLNRELHEEINLDQRYQINDSHHIVSYRKEPSNTILHFYGLEVTSKEFDQIERQTAHSHDYGTEVLGTIRPPLFTMEDNHRGFPAFLENKFVGNSMEQLLFSMQKFRLLSDEDLQTALRRCGKLDLYSHLFA